MKMSFWEAIATAPTYDLVFASIAILIVLGSIILFICLGIQGAKEKKLIKQFVKDNVHKIESVKYRIMTCSTLEKFYLIERWATAVAKNLKNEMVEMSYDYGCDYGNKIIKDINVLLATREEQLTSRILTCGSK